MFKPDYEGGSLLNLMATLVSALDLPESGYAPLSPRLKLDNASLSQSRHIILLVIDGLGDEVLTRHAPDSTLARHRLGHLTSVFPSTTASAIPTFLTGLPPQAHGLIGWHMWFEEIEHILAVLPLTPRGVPAGAWLPGSAPLPPRLFNHEPLSKRLAGRTWNVIPQEIMDSAFNRFHTCGAERIGYQGIAGLFPAIESAIAEAAKTDTGGKPSYIHAYFPALDTLMHKVGTRDGRVPELIAKLDEEFTACCDRLSGTGATMIVTADHGFIDAPLERLINLDQHPDLGALLNRPLCGERRISYAYVEHNRQLDFAHYVNQHLSHACELVPSTDFINAGWFGPGPAHSQLTSRAGNFVLLMKDDWTIKDWLPAEKRYDQLGVHGGASRAEMLVPLVVFIS